MGTTTAGRGSINQEYLRTMVAFTPEFIDTFAVELPPPENNPLYRALTALAPSSEWASVTLDLAARPGRCRVQLLTRGAVVPRHLELKVSSDAAVQEVWSEFDTWFSKMNRPERPNRR